MATTISNIKVDFGLGAAPPRVTFLQGANMDITFVRDVLRQIEESDEGRMAPGAVTNQGTGNGWIARAGGNFEFTESESSALVLEVLPPFDIFFEAGAIAFQTSTGSLLGTFAESPGAVVQINNAIGATNLQSEEIQHAAYDGGVHVDVTSPYSGTDPEDGIGNSRFPVNNWPDAVVINAREGFDQYFVEKSTTLDSAEDYTDASFVGKSIIDTILTIPAGSILDKAEFFNVSIEGTLGDVTIMQNCFLGETNVLNDVQGVIEDCSIGPAKLTLGGISTDIVRFVNCRGAGSQFSPPTVNCGGDGPEVDIQDYVGQINIENKTGDAVFEISITGKLTLDSSVINGTVIVNGIGTLEDNTGDGCTVINNMVQGIHLSEMWKLQGLETANPMTVTQTLRSTADAGIILALSGDGETSTTVTRQGEAALALDLPLAADLLDDAGSGITPTFTRASTATYLDGITGLVTTAAIDTPRFEVGGLLIEEARTNDLRRSSEFDNNGHSQYVYSNLTVNGNAGTAPDGTTTADDIVDNGTAGIHRIAYASSALLVGNTYAVSVYAKYIDHQWIAINDTQTTTYFDIQNGVVGTNANDYASIDDIGNGWYRCWFRKTISGAARQVHIFMAETDGDVSYSGVGEKVRLWGLQAEIGDFPTSHIPTTTSPAPRSADFLTYDDDTAVDNISGSVYVEVTPLFESDTANDAVILNIANQQAGPLYIVDDTTEKIAVNDGTNTSSFDPTFARGNLKKVASRWTTGEIQSIAGGASATAAAYDGTFTRTAGTLYIGSDSSGNHFNGNVRNVKVYSSDRGETQLLVDTG